MLFTKIKISTMNLAIPTSNIVPYLPQEFCLGVPGGCLGQCVTEGSHGLSNPSGMAHATVKRPNNINFIVKFV